MKPYQDKKVCDWTDEDLENAAEDLYKSVRGDLESKDEPRMKGASDFVEAMYRCYKRGWE